MSQLPKLSISDSFDGGNIELVEVVSPDGHTSSASWTVRLRIKQDVYTELEQMHHSQYFAFKSQLSSSSQPPHEPAVIRFEIVNAHEVSYPKAWQHYTVCVGKSLTDPNGWTRALDTAYSESDGILCWSVPHKPGVTMYCCYFPPFSYGEHLDLMAQCASISKVSTMESLGQSVEGRDLDCIVAGRGPLNAWIIHRQHPGETMASFFAQGLLTRMLGLNSGGEVDGLVDHALRNVFTFYVVPLMCPDGAVRGHLRTNGVGANLNREWATLKESYVAPSAERSPEVLSVLAKMDETGVDVLIDVHGDETLPFNFLSGAEGTHVWQFSPRLQHLHGILNSAYMRANPDMQACVGYPPSKPPPAVLAGQGTVSSNLAAKSVAERFNCLAVTLEMPFKDCLTYSHPNVGWSPNKSNKLGASLMDALVYVAPFLRTPDAFWNDWDATKWPLKAQDVYVAPSDKY